MNIQTFTTRYNKTAFANVFFFCITAVGLLPTYGSAQDAMTLDTNGYLGIGTAAPQRLMHLRGSNAVFRMDRQIDDGSGASFFLVGTETGNFDNILQAFQVGVIQKDGGSFIVNDTGAAAGGYGINRMKIDGNGDVYFGETERRNVYAASFIEQSSTKFKTDVTPLGSTIKSLQQLQGVRFKWKDTGKDSIGLIAEQVGEIFPEIVSYNDETGEPTGVHYSALTAVLLEAIKEQQYQLNAYRAELSTYQASLERQQQIIQQLQAIITTEDQIAGPLVSATEQ